MKTTIEVDDGAYYVAKAYAAEHRCSLGKAVSELILSPRNVEADSKNTSATTSWPSVRIGRVLTVDSVKELLAEDED